jgi:hypothetical protein
MSEVESTADQTESNDPLWQVQLASGQVCRMTLELLDDAFQDGLISENTLIMQDGTSEWVTLREVAGLDSEGESESSSSDTVVGATASVIDAAVVAQAVAEIPATAQVTQAVAVPMQAAPVQAPAPARPAEPRPFMDPFAPPIHTAAPVTQMVPPASPQAAPFVFQGATQGQLSYSPPPEPLTRSTAPVAADIDFDLEAVNFGKKRSPAKWIVGIAAVLGGLGFVAMNMNGTAESIPPAVAAPAAPAAYESHPTPAAEPTPAAPVVQAKAALSDDARKALLDADKARAAKMQQQRAAQPSRGGGGPSGPRKKSDPFHKGGDKYDPLNASL